MVTKPMGVCPACEGSTRRPVPESSRRYIKHNAKWGHWGTAGYQPPGPGPYVQGQGWEEGGTFPCNNCGGQTMFSKAIGEVPLRPDGTPCLHEYTHKTTRNCYHESTCKHCGFYYAIDSGD